MRRLLVALFALLCASGVWAGDEDSIRAVIAEQMAAFRRDDAAGAYAFATPKIQQQFGNADIFLEMVRTGYRPVYRPSSVEFLDLVRVEGQLVQRVHVIGPDGRPRIALYVMERQPDGSWKIDGCILTESDDKAT